VILKKRKNQEIYIVGGYLRDLLIGRKVVDRDYAVKGNIKSFVKGIASDLGGKVISPGKWNLYRIVLPAGIFLDFTVVNKSIEHDLSQRDFTINALAWSPERGIIDLVRGTDDLKRKTIKMIKEENIIEDPVRIIRAYRLAAKSLKNSHI
jgi:tRNA nucleotidyltransferase/poly(A) polymerase